MHMEVCILMYTVYTLQGSILICKIEINGLQEKEKEKCKDEKDIKFKWVTIITANQYAIF